MFKNKKIHPLRRIKKGIDARVESEKVEVEVKPKTVSIIVGTSEIASKFIAQRTALKEKVLKEVIDTAFPDMHEFNVDEFVVGKPMVDPPNKFIKLLRFLGILSVSVHEAIQNGSLKQLTNALDKASEQVKLSLMERSYIDEIDVRMLFFEMQAYNFLVFLNCNV